MTTRICKPATALGIEPVTRRIRCARCHGAVTLQFSDWSLPEARQQIWLCPYCERLNHGGFSGHLTWVTVR